MADIAELGITINSKGIEQGIKRLQDLGRTGEKSEASLAGLAKGVGNVAAVAATASTAVAGLVAVVADQVKETDDFAKAIGLTTSQLQQFQAAAKTVNIEADTMNGMLQDLNEKIGEALNEGTGEGAEALKILGIELKDITGIPVTEKLEMIGTALGDLEGQARKSAVGEMLFSDFTQILPLLEDGNKKLREMKEEALRTGQALSSFDNKALIEVSKSFETFGNRIDGATNLIAADLAPVIILVQKKIGSMIDAFDAGSIERFVSIGIDAIGVLLDVIQSNEMMLRRIGIGWTMVASFATGAMAESSEAVASLINLALSPMLDVLENVAKGWSFITGALADITPGKVSNGFRAASESLASFSDQVANFTVTSGDIKDANEAVNKSLEAQIKALDDLANNPAYSDQFKARLVKIRQEIEAAAKAEDAKRIASNKSAAASKRLAAAEKNKEDSYRKSGAEALKLLDAQKKLNKANEAAADRFKDLVNPVRVVIREYEEARRLFDLGLMSQEVFDQTKERLGALAAEIGQADWEKSGTDAGKSFAESMAKEIQSEIASTTIDFATGASDGKETARAFASSVFGAVGGAIAGPIGQQIGSAIGGSLVAKVKEELFTDVAFGGGGVTSAQSVTVRSKSSLLGSSRSETATLLGEEADTLDREFRESGRMLVSAFDQIGFDVSDSFNNFSTKIRVDAGDLGGAVDGAIEDIADEMFPSIESFARVGEEMKDVAIRIGENSEAISIAFGKIGVSATEIFDTSVVELSAELATEYQQTISDTEVSLAALKEQAEKIAGLELGLEGDAATQDILDLNIEGLTAFTFTKFVKQLNVDISESERIIDTAYSRLSGTTLEATVQVQDNLLQAVAGLAGIPIAQAGAELNSQLATFNSDFFSETEQLQITIDDSLETLSQFSDLGITTETSFSTLRDSIERFQDSEAFTPEGLARYLAAASALSEYSSAITDQANLSEAAANAIESSNDIIESSLSKLEETIGESSATVEGVQSGQDLPGIMSGIKDEFRGVINFIGGMRVSAEELQAAYDSATTAGLDLVEPLTETGIQVAQVYQDVLGRLPDQGGLDYWKNELESGALSFQQFFDLITESDEAALKDRFDGLLGAFNAYDAIAKLPPPPVEPVKDVVDIIESVADIGLNDRDLTRLRDLLDTLRGVSEQDRALENLNLTADGIDEFLSVIGGIDQTPENLAALADGLGLSVNEFVDSVETIADSVKETAGELFDFAAQVDKAKSDAERAVAAESDRLTKSYQGQIDAIRSTQDAESDLSEQRLDDARQSISNIRDIRRLLESSAKSVRASSLEIDAARQSAASAQIGAIIAGSAMPSVDEMESLLGDLTNISEDRFRTQEDFAFAQAVAANQIQALQEKTGQQLSVEEQALLKLEDISSDANDKADRQIELLIEERDEEIASNQAQLDALLDIDDSVMSAADALLALSNSISQLSASKSAPSGSGVIRQTGSGTGVSTTFKTGGGSVGVVDTGAFNQIDKGRSAAASGVNLTPSEIAAVLGLPAFASGGDHAGGPMLVGENGAEIVNTGASRVFNAAETSAMMSGMNPADLFRRPVTIDVSSISREISDMKSVMADLLTSISVSSGESASILDDFQVDGILINTDDGPVEVNQV